MATVIDFASRQEWSHRGTAEACADHTNRPGLRQGAGVHHLSAWRGSRTLPREAVIVPESGPISQDIRTEIRSLWYDRWAARQTAKNSAPGLAGPAATAATRELMRTLAPFRESLLWKKRNYYGNLLSQAEFDAIVARDEAYLGRRRRPTRRAELLTPQAPVNLPNGKFELSAAKKAEIVEKVKEGFLALGIIPDQPWWPSAS